jgi:carbon monoxide dehydrogenase subunit G
MATIYREFRVQAPVDQVWSALRDFGALHQVLARGFVLDCQLVEDTRVVTFSNGMVARERLVGIDDEARRLAYTSVGGQAAHHNASAQVRAQTEDETRFVWITDVLPDSFGAPIEAMMDEGIRAIRQTLESTAGQEY